MLFDEFFPPPVPTVTTPAGLIVARFHEYIAQGIPQLDISLSAKSRGDCPAGTNLHARAREYAAVTATGTCRIQSASPPGPPPALATRAQSVS